MTDFERLEEKASLYVMGELSEADRRDFESQMLHSPELQQLVRDLEEGAVAVALACPPRRPPPFLGRAIEQAIEEDRRKIIPIFTAQTLRNAGWAAAAACLAVWFFFGIYRNKSLLDAASNNGAAKAGTEGESSRSTAAALSQSQMQQAAEQKNEIARKQAEARQTESERLRADLANLQRQVGQMN